MGYTQIELAGRLDRRGIAELLDGIRLGFVGLGYELAAARYGTGARALLSGVGPCPEGACSCRVISGCGKMKCPDSICRQAIWGNSCTSRPLIFQLSLR